MKELVIVSGESVIGSDLFEREVRSIESIDRTLEIDLYKGIIEEDEAKPELVIEEISERYPSGLSLYNFRNTGYQIGGFNGKGTSASLYSNLEISYNILGKELSELLVELQIKAIATRKSLDIVDLKEPVFPAERRKTYVKLSDSSKKMFDKYITLEKDNVVREYELGVYDKHDVKYALEKYTTDKFYESKNTEKSFKDFCDRYEFEGNCVYGEVIGSCILKRGLRAFVVTKKKNFVYIDDRFEKALIVELPKPLILSNLEGLLNTLEYYIPFCIGGFNDTIGTYTEEENEERLKLKRIEEQKSQLRRMQL